jgi:hypothetical protein
MKNKERIVDIERKIDLLQTAHNDCIDQYREIAQVLAEKMGYELTIEDYIHYSWLNGKEIKQRPILVPIKKSKKLKK